MNWEQEKAVRREAGADARAAAQQDAAEDYDRGADRFDPWEYADYSDREFGMREP